MERGIDLLKNQIGKKLQFGKIQSFYLNDELIDQTNVLYLKFDTLLQITTSDETKILKVINGIPEQIQGWTDKQGVKFEYPIIDFLKSNKKLQEVIGKKLISFSELETKKYGGICCGLKLDFEEGLTLIIYSNSEELSFLNTNGSIPNDLKEKTL